MKSKKELLSGIYANQHNSCKRRDHDLPKYSRQEFYDWCYKQEKFHYLYNKWKDSGFDKWLTPSIDRLDDSISYIFNNIVIVTWRENWQKQQDRRLQGFDTQAIPVVQYDIDTGKEINKYLSVSEATRALGKNGNGILACLKGIQKTAYGYKWKRQNV